MGDFSDLFGMDHYLGFYGNVLIQALATRQYIIVWTTAALFHLGVCMYLGAMAQDLKWQFVDIDEKLREKRINHAVILKQIIGQIDFHSNILK